MKADVALWWKEAETLVWPGMKLQFDGEKQEKLRFNHNTQF